MKKYKKLAVFLSSVGVFCISTAARADVPTISGDFYEAHSAESSAYGVLGIIAIVCVVVAIALVALGSMRRQRSSKNAPAKNVEKK